MASQTSTAASVDVEAFMREHFDNTRFLRTNAGAQFVLDALEQGSGDEDEDAPPVPSGLLALPDLPQLRHCSARLEAADEAELRWRFANPLIASIRHSSGDFGRQLEHAASFGYGALPCRRCGGKWRSKRMPKGAQCQECRQSLPTGTTECPRCHAMFGTGWQDGTGQAPKAKLGKKGKRMSYATLLAIYRTTMQREHGIVLMSKPMPKPESGIDAESAWKVIADKFAADGKRLMTDGEFRELFPRLPDEECEPCKDCDGIGVVPRRSSNHGEVTAFPTGNSKQVGGREAQGVDALNKQLERGWFVKDGDATVGLFELERWVTVETVLRDVAGVAMIAREALEEYYTHREGARALLQFCPPGADGDRARAADELRDFMSRCWNLCAYGARS
jgi:hypothetical protein